VAVILNSGIYNCHPVCILSTSRHFSQDTGEYPKEYICLQSGPCSSTPCSQFPVPVTILHHCPIHLPPRFQCSPLPLILHATVPQGQAQAHLSKTTQIIHRKSFSLRAPLTSTVCNIPELCYSLTHISKRGFYFCSNKHELS
jgi:hypothetical protein